MRIMIFHQAPVPYTNHNGEVTGYEGFQARNTLDILQNMREFLNDILIKLLTNDFHQWSEGKKKQYDYMTGNLNKIDDLYTDDDECSPLPNKQRETWALIETLRGILSDLAGPDYTFDYVDGDLYRWAYTKKETEVKGARSLCGIIDDYKFQPES